VTSCSQYVPGLLPVSSQFVATQNVGNVDLFPVFPVGTSLAIYAYDHIKVTQKPGTVGTLGTMHGMRNLQAEHNGNQTWNDG